MTTINHIKLARIAGSTQRCALSPAALEAQAQRVLDGGWKRKTQPVCPACHVQRARNGVCGC